MNIQEGILEELDGPVPDKMEDARVITAVDAWDPSWRQIDQGGLVPMMRAAISAESTLAPTDPSRAIAEARADERDWIERIAYKVLRRDLADNLMAEVRKGRNAAQRGILK